MKRCRLVKKGIHQGIGIKMAVACLGAVILLVGCRGGHPAHPLPDDRTLSFVFYNVENLYDLIDDPQTNDEEYLPSGKKKWNEEKYRKKLADLSSVLAELGGDELPEIIGLCEVENRQVVQDLVDEPALQKGITGLFITTTATGGVLILPWYTAPMSLRWNLNDWFLSEAPVKFPDAGILSVKGGRTTERPSIFLLTIGHQGRMMIRRGKKREKRWPLHCAVWHLPLQVRVPLRMW